MALWVNRLSQKLPCLVLLALAAFTEGKADVSFSGVEATYYAGGAEDLKLTIDGAPNSSTGWSVGTRFEMPQAAVFTTAEPLDADLIEISLSFMSGRPHTAFADFSVSFTTDAVPSVSGKWEPIPYLNFSATTCELSRGDGNRLTASESRAMVSGATPDEIYRISARVPGKRITGFRIDAYPVLRSTAPSSVPVMAWALEGDFVLTEFRVEVISTSTNVALGALVTATHPLYETMDAGALTDGWPSTIAHPALERALGKDFHFEIDLGEQREIDHLGLRQRGDDSCLYRFGRMWIMLYDQDPKTGVDPVWQKFHRSDGSYPPKGEVDLLYEPDGQGQLRGRYIRITSENPNQGSPMLAEVEVYEKRTPQLVSAMVDGKPLADISPPEIPPGILRLGFEFEIPQTGRPLQQLYRWRLQGKNRGWLISSTPLLEIPCPPPGPHVLEVQAAHSDDTWDESLLVVPFRVKARFSQTPAFLWLIAIITLGSGVMVTRYFSRRKYQRLEVQSALATERSRIAANMHDDVGSRLAQLSVLHDIFNIEHELPPVVGTDLGVLKNCVHETMAALDEAVWTVNPRNDSLSALATFLMQYTDSYLSPLGISCRFHSPNEWPDIPVRSRIRLELVFAFKESLQNIVKHAKASEVELTLRYQAGLFSVRLGDNGLGFLMATREAGQDGLVNMRSRLESIRGSCEWIPRENGGTIVTMKLPLP